MNRNSKPCSHTDPNAEFFETIWLFLTFAGSVIKEIIKGVMEFGTPLLITLGVSAFLGIALNHGWDFKFLGKGSAFEFIWTNPLLRKIYFYSVMGLPAFLWGSFRVIRNRNYKNQMDTMFQASGVTNRIGQTPKPVQTFQTHDGSHILRVSARGISVDDLLKSKPALEQSLRAHIDGFESNIRRGTIDIKYSGEPMADEFQIGQRDLSILRSAEFIVGMRKRHLLRTDLSEVPHLLIAGETGGGKSTFLRQFITGLYLNDSEISFLLVDLKGGLEFHAYRGLPRLIINADLESAISSILNFESELERRFRLLEAAQCRDIESYNRKQGAIQLNRHVIVIDEVAELFLSGYSRSDGGLVKARTLLNRIARQGRAIGIHVVLATQRPDSRSLDSQIKANLTGVLCFAMVNDASSINVIGNGKATELPHIKGRALWKVGSEITEVQTPYLSEIETAQLFSGYRRSAATQSNTENSNANGSDRFRPLN